MFRFRFSDEKNRYELTELAKMFVPAEELDCFAEDGDFFVIPGPDEMDRNVSFTDTCLKRPAGNLSGERSQV